MKENCHGQPTTPQPAQNRIYRNLGQFGKDQHTKSCAAILALQRFENRMKLVLYAFNVKTDILNKILQTIKNAVNVQLMRNQFLVATMKLKLGLYHEIHHGLTSEMIISTNSSTNLAAAEKSSKLSQRKSHSNIKGDRRRQFMSIDSVIKNSVEAEFKFTQRQFTFFSSQEDVKTLTHCVADMPALGRDPSDDHITSQAWERNFEQRNFD